METRAFSFSLFSADFAIPIMEVDIMNDKELLSFEALMWLREHGFGEADHEQRVELIRTARELYPN